MTEQEHILQQLALSISNAIDRRMREGLPGLPRWRGSDRAARRRKQEKQALKKQKVGHDRRV